jgi:hypothetical protein
MKTPHAKLALLFDCKPGPNIDLKLASAEFFQSSSQEGDFFTIPPRQI